MSKTIKETGQNWESHPSYGFLANISKYTVFLAYILGTATWEFPIPSASLLGYVDG